MESPCFLRQLVILVAVIFFLSESPQFSLGHRLDGLERGGVSLGRRELLSLKETPAGGNTTFDCTPSGPCVPCQYSEKTEKKYRCSETGYRIPLKCVKIGDDKKQANGKRPQKSRSVLERSVNDTILESGFHEAEVIPPVKDRILIDKQPKGDPEDYVTYRSCLPAVNEEKLSVLGFEVFTFGLLLVSGSVVFIRRRRTAPAVGAGGLRVQNNSRF